MNIEKIYTLDGEITEIYKDEYPKIVDRVEIVAIETYGLEKLKEKEKDFVNMWKDVYLSDKMKKFKITFIIYKNIIVNNIIMKDLPIFKSELKNY